jgi:hypothetical protein
METPVCARNRPHGVQRHDTATGIARMAQNLRRSKVRQSETIVMELPVTIPVSLRQHPRTSPGPDTSAQGSASPPAEAA